MHYIHPSLFILPYSIDAAISITNIHKYQVFIWATRKGWMRGQSHEETGGVYDDIRRGFPKGDNEADDHLS